MSMPCLDKAEEYFDREEIPFKRLGLFLLSLFCVFEIQPASTVDMYVLKINSDYSSHVSYCSVVENACFLP